MTTTLARMYPVATQATSSTVAPRFPPIVLIATLTIVRVDDRHDEAEHHRDGDQRNRASLALANGSVRSVVLTRSSRGLQPILAQGTVAVQPWYSIGRERRRPLFSLRRHLRSSRSSTPSRSAPASTDPCSIPRRAPAVSKPRSREFRAVPARPRDDVLVLGDSRIYSGLDPQCGECRERNPALPQRRRPRHHAALLAVLRARDRSAGDRLSRRRDPGRYLRRRR